MRPSSGRIVGVQADQLLHQASSNLDAPGAPVWVEGNGRRLLVAVTSPLFSGDGTTNLACFLNEEARSRLTRWIDEDYERK